jgi:glycosyltransferase involved in cell wall biosynthesis
VRVLHLTDHYPPVLGGIETHVAALAERQARLGDDVTVLTSSPPHADGRQGDDDGPVKVRRAQTLMDRAGVDLAAYDVVHAHLSVVAPYTAPMAAAAARTGTPTVVTVHSLWSKLGPIPALAVELAGLRRAPVRWTAVSRVAADDLAGRLPGRPHVGVLPNAVEVSARVATPAADPDRPLRVVSTMRVARRKRPLPLLRLFAEVERSVARPVELAIIGDGPLRSRVERWARRQGLQDRVTVTGRVEPDEVRALLAAADVYVAPAVLESFGLAALEARAVGLPVVGRAGTGLSEFITHGVEGLLCDSDRALASGLTSLLVDDGLRRRVSEHNRVTPHSQTWQRAVEATVRTYDAARANALVVGVD